MGHHPDDLTKLVVRVIRISGSRYVNLPRPIMHHLAWNDADLLRVQCVNGSLILTRIPLEEIGKQRIAEHEAG